MATGLSDTHRSGVRRSSTTYTPTDLKHLSPRPALDPIASVNRETISWKRKVFHVLGIGTVGLVYGLAAPSAVQALLILGAIALVFCSLDIARFYFPALNRKVRRDFGPYMRNYELNKLSGSSWFFFASLITIALFPREAAAAAFLCLAIGDPVASWVGVKWGRLRLPGGKSLEGSLALFGICFAVSGAYFALATPHALGLALGLAAVSAAAAAVSEWLPVRGVDDNFRVPVLTAAATTGCLALLV